MFISAYRRSPATPDIVAVVMLTTGSPYVAAYAFDAVSGWGDKLADPSTVLTGSSFK